MNHSCNPNVAWVVNTDRYNSNTVSLVAIKDTNTDDEFTFAYSDVDIRQWVKYRQRQSMSNYCFICQCSRCIYETTTIEGGLQDMKLQCLHAAIQSIMIIHYVVLI